MVWLAIRIAKWVFALGALAIILGWLVLAAPFFSEFRQRIVANVLTEELGQPIEVHDDVSVVLGPISRVRAGGVRIPSENIADTMLAELALLELDVDVIQLLKGIVDLDNVTVDGLQVKMVVQEDGTTSWTPSTQPETTETDARASDEATETPDEASGGIFGFLRHRTASFTAIGLKLDDQDSGFFYDFKLDRFTMEQLDGGDRLGINGQGAVNNQDFKIQGSYPTGAPFTTRASFGELVLGYDGAPVPKDQGGGHSALLTLDTGAFGDFLEVLGLERVLEGSGKLNAELTNGNGMMKVEDLSIVIDLDKGQQLKADGSVQDLLNLAGFDVRFNARFHPKGQPPADAATLKDLKLTGISTHIVSDGDAIELDELLLSTNAFDQGLNEVGPVSFGRLHRTPSGLLALENLRLQAGPRGAPYILAQGDIENLLQLKQLLLNGKLSAPASLVLTELGEDVAHAFGGVEADFTIDDAEAHLRLTDLEARTVNTDIWALKASLALGNVVNLDGIAFDLDLDIADGAQFLGALKLKEIDTGPLEISASLTGKGRDISTRLGLAAGTSRIDASLDTTVTEGRPVIDGRVFSERLSIDDLKNAVGGVVELGKIGDDDKTPEKPAEPEEPKVQPLVLPKKERRPTDLVDLEKLLLDTDLTVGIDIHEIVGQQGVSSVSSELVARDGQARLGPLEVAYGGGFFKLAAEMDLVKSPEIVSVSGATSGWDFGRILDSVGLGIESHGTLSGHFNVTGNRSSIRTFINSMQGSAAISMSRGDIATSLLELAGLGIFPWLFSEEFQRGYTDIVCVVAPVTINGGTVSFESVVAETKSVQLVARGHVDWRNDSISVRAEPRRVGNPLARSAWPFDVTGKLSEPKFKLDIGGSRTKRTDGASEMPENRKPCVPDLSQLE